MFQSSNQRKTADDQPICVGCENNDNCTFKPNHRRSWNFVLTYCAKFKQKDGEGK